MKVLSLVLLLAAGVEGGGTRHFPYERPLLRSAGSTGQTCAVVPAEVFAHAAPRLGDLRLFAASAETPYALRRATRPAANPVTLPLLNLGTVHGATSFEADMPAGDAYRDLLLETSAHDFIATVTVTGSHGEGSGVRVTLGTFTIFDLSGQKLGRSTVLHLPLTDLRHLQFTMHGPVVPAAVTGLTLQTASSAAEVPYTLVAASTTVKQDGKRSVVTIAVPPHVPVDRIVFQPGAFPASFSRDVSVAIRRKPGSAPAPDEETVEPARLSGNILRVHKEEDGRRVDEERLAVPTYGTVQEHASEWEMAVENGDDAPLPLTGVQLQMEQRTICFEAAADTQYTLFYGDEARTAPTYDYQRLSSAIPHPAQSTAGPEQANPDYEPRADSRPFTERHPVLLWTGLLLTLGVLGLVALRSAKPTHPAEP